MVKFGCLVFEGTRYPLTNLLRYKRIDKTTLVLDYGIKEYTLIFKDTSDLNFCMGDIDKTFNMIEHKYSQPDNGIMND